MAAVGRVVVSWLGGLALFAVAVRVPAPHSLTVFVQREGLVFWFREGPGGGPFHQLQLAAQRGRRCAGRVRSRLLNMRRAGGSPGRSRRRTGGFP